MHSGLVEELPIAGAAEVIAGREIVPSAGNANVSRPRLFRALITRVFAAAASRLSDQGRKT
jgi:hypothetical protein